MPERVRPQLTRSAASTSTPHSPGRDHAGSSGRPPPDGGASRTGTGGTGEWSAGSAGRSVRIDMPRSVDLRPANPLGATWEHPETRSQHNVKTARARGRDVSGLAGRGGAG